MPPTTDSERRQKILEAAERLLKHYGFAKTTVSDIAREAEIGVGTVYLEFGSKDEIVGAVSLKCHAARVEAMQGHAAAAGSYASRLKAVLGERLRRLRTLAEESHGLDLVSCRCEAVQEVLTQFRRQEEELLCKLLEDAERAGEFSVANVATTARALLRICDGLSPAFVRRPLLAEAQEEFEAIQQVVLVGLLRR